MKDYDYTIHYHHGKPNVVSDALHRKKVGQLLVLRTEQKQLIKDFENMKIQVLMPSARIAVKLVALTLLPTHMNKIINAQKDDPFLEKIRATVGTKKGKILR